MNLTDVVRDLETRREHLSIAIDVLKAYGNSLPQVDPAPQPLIETTQPEAPAAPGRPGRVLKTAKAGRRGGRKSGASTPHRCDKHPDATEFDPKGRCRQCMRDYAREWAKKRKAGKATSTRGRRPAAEQPPLDDDDDAGPGRGRSPGTPRFKSLNLADDDVVIDDDPDLDEEEADEAPTPAAAAPRQFIWSKPQKCPKCGEMARLRRLASADKAKDMWIHVGPNCTIKIAHYQIKDDLKSHGDQQ